MRLPSSLSRGESMGAASCRRPVMELITVKWTRVAEVMEELCVTVWEVIPSFSLWARAFHIPSWSWKRRNTQSLGVVVAASLGGFSN